MNNMDTEFKPATFPFTKNGWTHECIERKGLVVLTRRHKNGLAEHFEVIRLHQVPRRVWQQGAREIESLAHEAYPSDEEWGTYGFTYSANSHIDPLAAAHQKFADMSS